MAPAPIHLSTILSRTPTGLLGGIKQLSKKYGQSGHTVLFALSANFPHSEDLQTAVEHLTNFNGPLKHAEPAVHVLGCLSDSFSNVSFNGGVNAKSIGDAGTLSCSIGIFDSAHCVPFRSDLAGRRQPQVGRWHAFRQKDDENGASAEAGKGADWEMMKNSASGEVNWESIWTSSSTSPKPSSLLPDALKRIEPSRIRQLVAFSSAHPDKLTRALADYISGTDHSAALTLVAAPTQFVTGRDVTLFMDGQIFSDGAVGLAFLHPEGEPGSREIYGSEFVGMKKLSGPMTVTSREGNMINALDQSNPTRLLLDAIASAGIGASKGSSSSPFTASFKEDEQFALALLAPGGEIQETYKITAGDPSSRGGSLSLDAPHAPRLGSTVQFLHCPANSRIVVPSSLLSTAVLSDTSKTMAFITVPEMGANKETATSDIINDYHIFENVLMAPSTRGFISSRPTPKSAEEKSTNLEPWTSSLPGGIGLIKWL